MNKLEIIKNEVVKEFGYKSFEEFDDKNTFSYDHKTPQIINKIAIRFATVAINDYLESQKQRSKESLFLKLEQSANKNIKSLN